jgi:peptidyl-prolyl cis-trans isomerase A (cyclophilin A)
MLSLDRATIIEERGAPLRAARRDETMPGHADAPLDGGIRSRRSEMNRNVLALTLTCFVLFLFQSPSLAEEEGAAVLVEPQNPALLDPTLGGEQAPEEFRVEFDTTKGKFVIEVHRAWAPAGADRFYSLVKIGFFEDIAFFRVIPNFMAQFGIHGDPAVTKAWRAATIQDDPVVQSNERGYITYAKTRRPNSRTTQLFINLKDNKGLDRQGFAPFGKVVEGMDVVDSISKIGEGAPRGPGPAQGRIQSQGNAYLKEKFSSLDYLKSARLLEKE